ncbi:ECF transporter S component [Clostridium gasigenes]|uniref:Riboflavin transporter n=1 Tax=Clostridium gasigenes TaxID=94869 RepID=A0A7X0SD87_9CLOT|nr:ECF transporter S component [Clostridium gasigenes]MBB6714233.1 ECF transporter S component [Clostridium gasigenes]
MKNERKKLDVNKCIKISLLGAISVILMYFDFPVIPMFPWLKIDLSDVPALMGAFAFGPMTGIVIEGLKNILILIVKGTGTAFVGEIANFIIGISLIAPTAYIYNRNKSRKTALIGMAVGFVSVQIAGIITNVYFLLPAFGMQMDKVQTLQYVTVGLLPFNGIKAVLVFAITYVLYKKVSRAIFKVEPALDRK